MRLRKLRDGIVLSFGPPEDPAIARKGGTPP